MSRRKKPADAWMPSRVYRGRSAYEYHPKSGGNIRLASLKAERWEVLKAHAELLERHNQVGSLNGLMTEFYESADFAALSQTTQKDYFKYGRKVALVFGTVDPDAIQPKHIRKYMDKRGAKAPTQANREKTFLSRVYRWAYERGKVKMNPCAGVRAFKEAPRDRYIEDWEYKAVYDRAPLHVQIAMEISYLCAARKTDVLTMAWEQVREEGIFIQQGKTGFKQIKAWTPRLKAALDKAKTLPKDRVATRWVICQSNGNKYTNRGFDQGWMSAREQAREELNAAMDFTFHDLKAKAISDYEGSSKDKQVFSGHKTENQVATYDRKVKVTPTLGSK